MMKREILFRGKRLQTGEWIFGDLANQDGRSFIIPNCITDCVNWDSDTEFNFEFEVDVNTVGMYSNSEDNSGKMIFEHDLLICEDEDGELYLQKVVYTEIYSHDWLTFHGFKTEEIKRVTNSFEEYVSEEDLDFNKTPILIGNIHDNHKLIGASRPLCVSCGEFRDSTECQMNHI